jgi:hypothetical protein
MTGRLFKEMHENPTEIYGSFVSDVSTYLVEARCSRDDRVDLSPDLLSARKSHAGTR